jgi:dienelactone hydrolase
MSLDNGAKRVDGVRDIKATTDHLVAAGIADPRRLGIMGGSYGGYMVMAGVTEYPDMFAAGANLFGVVNFDTFFKNTQPWMAAISTIEYGDPATEAEMLKALSPIHKLDRIKTPLIVLHGANDTNVPADRGGADRRRSEAPQHPGRICAVPGRGPWLAQAPQPGPLDHRDRQLLRSAAERSVVSSTRRSKPLMIRIGASHLASARKRSSSIPSTRGMPRSIAIRSAPATSKWRLKLSASLVAVAA